MTQNCLWCNKEYNAGDGVWGYCSKKCAEEAKASERKKADDKKSGGGCFITTAVCQSLGKPDDCEELMLFRQVRDTWLLDQPHGESDIAEYYRIAPQICAKIEALPDPLETYLKIEKTWISPVLSKFRERDYEGGYSTYRNMVNELSAQFLLT